jgi:hypothetical protein
VPLRVEALLGCARTSLTSPRRTGAFFHATLADAARADGRWTVSCEACDVARERGKPPASCGSQNEGIL